MNRKQFLSNIAGAAALLSMPKALSALTKNKKQPIGIQLWTLKENMDKDPINTIKVLNKMGYNFIETFDGKQGMFWGQSSKDFLKFVNDNNLNLLSGHININENFEKKVEQAAEAQMKYLMCPWLGPQKNLDEYKKAAEKFNWCGEICKKHNIKFGYHNHAYSFKKHDNEYPQDIIIKNTQADLVVFEMDIYWVVTAGENPIEWIKKYPYRFELCHIKDREKNAVEDFASCILGNGSIDYATIISNLKKLNMKHFIVEQEKFSEGTSLECVQKNALVLNKWLKVI